LKAEKVFIAQKWMIEKANIAAKPIIICDQIINTMVKSPRPTRAEAGDISTSILDGTDAVLLNRETANGDYPINCVSILAKICCESEKTFDNKKYFNDIKMYTPVPYGTAESCACAAVQSILELNIDMVIVLTESGKLARLVSKFKPAVPILCCSPHAQVVKQVNTSSGVLGFKIPSLQGQDGLLQFIIKKAKDMRLCRQGNKIISIQGSDEDTPQESNVMKIVDIE
jgi:pyruvate kinase